MTSRLPNESDENSVLSTAAAASAFQSALAQQVRPGLPWDPVTAMASLDRNILQQLQQQHHQQNSAPTNPSAVGVGAGAGPNSSNSLSNLPAALWQHYGFQAGLQQNNQLHHQTQQQQPSQRPASSVSLASLTNPAAAANYLSHLTQNLQNPEALMSLQHDLLVLEQQRQMLATNQHLLMAAAQAAQASPQNQNLTHTQDPSSALAAVAALQSSIHHSLLSTMMANGLNGQSNQSTNNQNANNHRQSPSLINLNNNHSNNTSQWHPLLGALSGNPNVAMPAISQNEITNSNNLATSGSNLRSETYNSVSNTNNSLSPPLTNQHQDSLVDQHFRRSLGDDYNQIMAKKH